MRSRSLQMLMSLSLALSACAPVDAPVDTAPSVEDEFKNFQGTWSLVSYAGNGNRYDSEALKECSVVISGRGLTIKSPQTEELAKVRPELATPDGITVAFMLDVTVRPRRINLTGLDGKMVTGIYHLEKGMLTVCFSPASAGYPATFTADASRPSVLLALKRAERGE